jgi:hypothetical protein
MTNGCAPNCWNTEPIPPDRAGTLVVLNHLRAAQHPVCCGLDAKIARSSAMPRAEKVVIGTGHNVAGASQAENLHLID